MMAVDEAQNGFKRRMRRFRVVLESGVEVKFIGTTDPYEFTTGNISTGGLFIRGDREDYPFNRQSILEIQLDLGDRNISFLAKVVHKRGNGFGVRIIQIEDRDQDKLESFISEYAESNPESVVS